MDAKWEKLIFSRVKTLFAGDSSGHDYYHTLRVYHLAQKIAVTEDCDREIVMLAALLHDADDIKLFHTDDYANAREILRDCGFGAETEARVIGIIRQVSFKGTDSVKPASIEGQIVQDADRLDALGAIGIVRAFAYGGAKGRMLYDPNVSPVTGMDEAAYRQNAGPILNHFYEKLLLLKDLMNTEAAKQIAGRRQMVMEEFLRHFWAEWNGES